MTRSQGTPKSGFPAAARGASKAARPRVLPGFEAALGLTLAITGVLVLLPLSSLLVFAGRTGVPKLFATLHDERVLASLRLTLSTSLLAAVLASVSGLLVSWVLTRYEFPGRRLLDALVDLPFALPTSVAGIALTTLYAPSGLLGKRLAGLGVEVAYTPLGIVAALVFIGFPFAVRTIQPVLADLEPEVEECARSLGATPLQTFFRVLLPEILPALLTGFAMAFARGLGEYGSVVFIAGNVPMKTEVAPLLIMTKLEQYDYAGAAALATVLLLLSFALLFLINRLQGWAERLGRRGA
ncbi:MAG: sulfate ABC transporter permease subunit CysT [Acidobacteria bacterium]|nr:sulfate ABC transporter permease subunit CysT [Acidobacteriota bacterium]